MAMQSPTRMLRLPEVLERTGLARSTIYSAMARGAFPLPRKLTSAVNGWPEREVEDWLNSRPVAPVQQADEADG